MSVIHFNPEGPITSIAASTVAPSAVQIVSSTGVNCTDYLLQNANATIDVTVAWGGSTQEASANAGLGASGNQFFLPAAERVIVVARPSGFFTGTTTTNSATFRVQPGSAE